MSAIAKLQARPTLQRDLVQQAMTEAKADPKAQEKLQQLVDTRAGDFEDQGLVDTVQQFLQGLCKDSFEVVANRTTGTLGKPEVLEARITKVKDEHRRVDITPPPPAPPVWRRDPLNVTGKASAGSTVEFYNASLPGRPVLGSVTADASGKFSYELTDETKFVFGDQIGVRLVGGDGQKGRALIVPTEPFLITNTETTYFRRQNGVETDVRTDRSSRTDALDKKTDDRAPFVQLGKVDQRLEIPSQVEQPYQFTLIGKDDSVEPNSTVSVKVGHEVYQTKVDDQGQFALKVKDIIPGQQLKIEVRDINGHGVDIPARVPPIALPTPQIIGAMQPDADGIRLNVADLVPPGGALIVRNARTGVISELGADAKGKVDGRIAGISPFDAFEVAVRDVNGHVSDDTALLVSMPAVGKQKAGVVKDIASLNQNPPALHEAIGALVGPPVDVVVGGQKRAGGPFLPLQGLPKLPPFAILEVVKDGAIVQSMRADEHGKLDGMAGMIRGVHVGDALSFRLRDAAGRQFPGTVEGFVVPDGKVKSKVTTVVEPALSPLLASTVGLGAAALDPVWLAPATIHVGKTAPTDFQQQHAVTSQLGGAINKAPDHAFMANHFPDTPLTEGATLSVTHGQGHKTISVDVKGEAGSPFQFRYDDTLGTFQPALTAADIPRLQSALKGAVAVVGAAYAQGKEPGDIGYDRALGVAKSIVFMMDQLATSSPADSKAVQDAAVAVLGKKPFLFEVSPKGVVGAGRGVDIQGQTSSSMSLLQTRTMAMGEIGRSDRLSKSGRGPVDIAALSSASSYDQGALKIAGKGLLAPGDELLIKAGDSIHRVSADAKGNVDVSLAIASGTVVEIAQRQAPKDGASGGKEFNPIRRAVVSDADLMGEGHLVAVSALTQRGPDASAVADQLLNGGPATKGLPPGGSVVVIKDGVEVARTAIGADGALGAARPKLNNGDVVDVHVEDAAGRAFAGMVEGQVIGQKIKAESRLDTTAMSIADVVDQVGSGRLRLPTFDLKDEFPEGAPGGKEFGSRKSNEIYVELKPMWGNSAGFTEEHGRFSTKAAVPDGLLPALAFGPEVRRLDMGDSLRLSSTQWDDGKVNLHAGYYVENQRPDFGVVFDPKTGELSDRFNSTDPLVPQGLAKLTTLLQSAIACVALAQKNGSEPGDGFYDVAARTAKSTLVVFDSLVQKNPTLKTEILAAMRAALPPSMPFDLPVGNAPAAAQTPPTDAHAPATVAFWNAVGLDDYKAERDAYRPVPSVPVTPGGPLVGGSFFGGGQNATSEPFFKPSRVPFSLATVPAHAPNQHAGQETLPLYLRGRR